LAPAGRAANPGALSPIRRLTGLILVKVLAPGFYARQDIRTPVRIAIITAGADRN